MLLKEIIGNLNTATENAVTLVKALLETNGGLCDENYSCRKSLELADWTNPQAIDPKVKQELSVLFK